MAEALEAEHYREVRNKLADDPIVLAMAEEIRFMWEDPAQRKTLVYSNHAPRHELMDRANDEYRERGGTVTEKHIGAVAEALVMIWQDDEAESHARAVEGV